ncbi:MAG: leucine-rich repeat domain-containing protein, partial [Oscillospiraceae bacterium]|nr:leucine-rich repeat domain-containing protein [Oscillospiraceae bacterium]
MKKFLASVLSITIVMSLAACNGKQPEQTTSSSSETTTQVTETTETVTETTAETTSETTEAETTTETTAAETTTETSAAAPKVVNLTEPKLDAAKDFKWSLKDGVLTLSGNGAMPNYKSETKIPWYKNRKKITKVVFNGNITRIGAYAFADCTKLKSITIPDSVQVIGEMAFMWCEF